MLDKLMQEELCWEKKMFIKVKWSHLLSMIVFCVISFSVHAQMPLTDDEITQSLFMKAAFDKTLAGTKFNAQTQSGVVSLIANLDTVDRAIELMALTLSLPNVNNIDITNLQLNGGPIPFDAILTARVKANIVRSKLFGSLEVYELPITVETNNGIVFLIGPVDNQDQMFAVIKLAQRTPGVPRVISALYVRASTVYMPN